MAKNRKIEVQGAEITVVNIREQDFISLTDIAKYKTDDTSAVIGNWMRNRNTLEFLGIWESLYNPDFKPLEFEGFKKQAGLNIHTDAIKENLIPPELTKQQISFVYASEADILNMALFGKTAKQWRDEHSEKKGNIRDYANVRQLVCLVNLENLNAHFIRQGLNQSERLRILNNTAIQQMRLLSEDSTSKRLDGGKS
jgi:hypothetical protein